VLVVTVVEGILNVKVGAQACSK